MKKEEKEGRRRGAQFCTGILKTNNKNVCARQTKMLNGLIISKHVN